MQIPLLEGEESRPLPGYEGLYSITSFGRVWSHSKVRRGRTYGEVFVKPRSLREGYLLVTLTDQGQRRDVLLQRLVAEAFHLNPGNHPEVNHKDGVKSNCHKDNLEWVTTQQNQTPALMSGLRRKSKSIYYGVTRMEGSRWAKRPWVAQVYDPSRKSLGYYATEIEAARAYNNYILTHSLNKALNEL